MVKIIDIDLERRRISLSLKQANEGVDATADDFDPTLYGMAASYDDQGNYLYPDGLRPGDGRMARGVRGAARGLGAPVRRGSRPLGSAQEAGRGRRECGQHRGFGSGQLLLHHRVGHASPTPAAPEGSLASDEALQALREKLTGAAS